MISKLRPETCQEEAKTIHQEDTVVRWEEALAVNTVAKGHKKDWDADQAQGVQAEEAGAEKARAEEARAEEVRLKEVSAREVQAEDIGEEVLAEELKMKEAVQKII